MTLIPLCITLQAFVRFPQTITKLGSKQPPNYRTVAPTTPSRCRLTYAVWSTNWRLRAITRQ